MWRGEIDPFSPVGLWPGFTIEQDLIVLQRKAMVALGLVFATRMLVMKELLVRRMISAQITSTDDWRDDTTHGVSGRRAHAASLWGFF
jgi:hypothetical protein